MCAIQLKTRTNSEFRPHNHAVLTRDAVFKVDQVPDHGVFVALVKLSRLLLYMVPIPLFALFRVVVALKEGRAYNIVTILLVWLVIGGVILAFLLLRFRPGKPLVTMVGDGMYFKGISPWDGSWFVGWDRVVRLEARRRWGQLQVTFHDEANKVRSIYVPAGFVVTRGYDVISDQADEVRRGAVTDEPAGV